MAGGDPSKAWHIGAFDDGRFFFWTPAKFIMTLDSKSNITSVVNLVVTGGLDSTATSAPRMTGARAAPHVSLLCP